MTTVPAAVGTLTNCDATGIGDGDRSALDVIRGELAARVHAYARQDLLVVAVDELHSSGSLQAREHFRVNCIHATPREHLALRPDVVLELLFLDPAASRS